jgi:hypothetical protein
VVSNAPVAPDAIAPRSGAPRSGAPTGRYTPKPGPITARRSAVPGSLLMVSTKQKLDLAGAAMKLRDEQVSARIIFFDPDQKTNAELDKITESVIAELKAIQNVRGPSATSTASLNDREAELTAMLRVRLEQLLDPKRAAFIRSKLDTLSRRVTTLFFEAALGHNATPDELAARVVTLPEQAVYYAMLRSKAQIVDDLQSLNYESEDVYNESLDRLARLEKDLQVSLLSRKAPELEKLLPVVIEVFTEFFTDSFRKDLRGFTSQVVKESRAAADDGRAPKISAEAFPRFREAFERGFLERLVMGVQEPIILRLEAMEEESEAQLFQDETLDFIADPRVFSVVCGVMCDAFYDAMHSDGLLELPAAWRNADPGIANAYSRVWNANAPPSQNRR